MIDVLLINPNEHAEEIVRVLSTSNISYLIVTTNGNMFAYSENLNHLNLNIDSWPKEETFRSAIAWGIKGQKFLDGITRLGQVSLANKASSQRIANYQDESFKSDMGRMFNLVSYKGSHAVLDAFVYKNKKWHLLKDHSIPFYINGANTAFDFLDQMGILNGPTQVFIDLNGSKHIRMHYRKLSNTPSARNFIDIWTNILKTEASNPSNTFANFFIWVGNTGKDAKDFYLAKGL